MVMNDKTIRKAIAATDAHLSSRIHKIEITEETEKINKTLDEISPITNMSFEKRYEKILNVIDKDNLMELPNPHDPYASNAVTDITDIDCAKDGFIEKHCFGKVDKNLLLDNNIATLNIFFDDTINAYSIRLDYDGLIMVNVFHFRKIGNMKKVDKQLNDDFIEISKTRNITIEDLLDTNCKIFFKDEEKETVKFSEIIAQIKSFFTILEIENGLELDERYFEILEEVKNNNYKRSPNNIFNSINEEKRLILK